MVSKIKLYDHQIEASKKLRSGSVLCGGVGTGKTLTSLDFYKRVYPNKKLYVITIAKKRDSKDWNREAELLGINELIVDSWNNIANYTKVRNAFFIFDEQRAVGTGAWSKSMIKIAKANKWVMCTATPGDVWMDYLTLFLANGFYENKTHFINQHVVYDRFAKYPRVKQYLNQHVLKRYRDRILVTMEVDRHTVRHRNFIETFFDKDLYGDLIKNRFNFITNKPIKNASELTQLCRRVVATSDGRMHEAAWQIHKNDRLIIFYNWDYELEILRDLCEFLGKSYSEWNGHKHQEPLDGAEWVYLTQYTAASEAWNCITCNNVMFYSPNYSYRIMEQCEGRIDRMDTPFIDLNYIYLLSDSSIDKAVMKAINTKRTFNESIWGRRRVA